MKFLACLTTALLFAGPAFAQEVEFEQTQRVEKAIPIYQDPPKAQPVIAGQGYSVTVDPASASATPIDGGITRSLQQTMRLAVEQAISPFFWIKYGAETGFLTQETDLDRQQKQQAAYLTMLQRPALTWKSGKGPEAEVAYEHRDNVNNEFQSGDMDAIAAQATVKLSEKQSLKLTARDEHNRGYAGEKSSQITVQASTERSIGTEEVPLKLQVGPGYQRTVAADSTDTLRAFINTALLWQVDSFTVISVGHGFAGSGLATLSESGFVALQHKIFTQAAIELRAAMLQSRANDPAEGYTLTAASTVALAEALSAGLSVQYKMDENPILSQQAAGETFLSFTINGKF